MDKSKSKGYAKRLSGSFLRREKSALKDEKLLELLLTYAIPQEEVQPLATRLISEYGSLSLLLETPMETLCQFDGMRENSALLLKLVDWIRQHHPPKRSGKKPVNIMAQPTLFDVTSPGKEQPASRVYGPRHKKITPRRGSVKFSNAVLKEAIQILPSLPDNDSLDEARAFIRAKLHFSAEQTRHRYANYITRRMFPEGYADAPLRSFAKSFPDSQELREVCFYRFIMSEPLEVEIIEDLLLPNLGTGRLRRSRIRRWLSEKFSEARSISGCAKAIVDALTAAGIAKADKTKITFSYREIPAASFAFVLHSEFPEPGMYHIRKVDENRIIRAMLWNPERLLHALYELRNRGLISKVSEIDSIRQFTTKHTLPGVVEQIASRVKEQ